MCLHTHTHTHDDVPSSGQEASCTLQSEFKRKKIAKSNVLFIAGDPKEKYWLFREALLECRPAARPLACSLGLVHDPTFKTRRRDNKLEPINVRPTRKLLCSYRNGTVDYKLARLLVAFFQNLILILVVYSTRENEMPY